MFASEPDFSRRERELAIEARIRELSAHRNVIDAEISRLSAELEALVGTTPWDFNSAAHWLSVTTGMARREAHRAVRVGRRLPELQELSAAMETGELSLAKADAIAAIATEKTETELVQFARDATAEQTQRMASGYRRAVGLCRVDERGEPLAPESRYLSVTPTESGMERISGRMDPEEAALFKKALEAARQKLFEEDPDGFRRGSPSVDALVRIAATSLEHDAPEDLDRYQVVVHVDAATLLGYRNEHGECHDGYMCELDDGTKIDLATLECIACDAAFYAVLEDEDDQPLNVSRLTRRPPRRIRRALRSRDRTCRFPGCDRASLTQAHHLKHWTRDLGETRIENFVNLCWIHHKQLHRGEFSIEGDPTIGLRFVTRNGRVIGERLQPASGPPIEEQHRAAGLGIDPNRVPRWGGDPLQLDYTVELFMSRDDPEDWRTGTDP